MSAFNTAGELINAVTDWLYTITLSDKSRAISISLPTLILIVLCIGWVIHSLANKEP